MPADDSLGQSACNYETLLLFSAISPAAHYRTSGNLLSFWLLKSPLLSHSCYTHLYSTASFVLRSFSCNRDYFYSQSIDSWHTLSFQGPWSVIKLKTFTQLCQVQRLFFFQTQSPVFPSASSHPTIAYMHSTFRSIPLISCVWLVLNSLLQAGFESDSYYTEE